jgi:hypothetical protein
VYEHVPAELPPHPERVPEPFVIVQLEHCEQGVLPVEVLYVPAEHVSGLHTLAPAAVVPNVNPSLHAYEHVPALVPLLEHPLMETVPFSSVVGLHVDKLVHRPQGA